MDAGQRLFHTSVDCSSRGLQTPAAPVIWVMCYSSPGTDLSWFYSLLEHQLCPLSAFSFICHYHMLHPSSADSLALFCFNFSLGIPTRGQKVRKMVPGIARKKTGSQHGGESVQSKPLVWAEASLLFHHFCRRWYGERKRAEASWPIPLSINLWADIVTFIALSTNAYLTLCQAPHYYIQIYFFLLVLGGLEPETLPISHPRLSSSPESPHLSLGKHWLALGSSPEFGPVPFISMHPSSHSSSVLSIQGQSPHLPTENYTRTLVIFPEWSPDPGGGGGGLCIEMSLDPQWSREEAKCESKTAPLLLLPKHNTCPHEEGKKIKGKVGNYCLPNFQIGNRELSPIFIIRHDWSDLAAAVSITIARTPWGSWADLWTAELNVWSRELWEVLLIHGICCGISGRECSSPSLTQQVRS